MCWENAICAWHTGEMVELVPENQSARVVAAARVGFDYFGFAMIAGRARPSKYTGKARRARGAPEEVRGHGLKEESHVFAPKPETAFEET